MSGTITIPEVAHDTAEDEYVVCSLSIIYQLCEADFEENSHFIAVLIVWHRCVCGFSFKTTSERPGSVEDCSATEDGTGEIGPRFDQWARQRYPARSWIRPVKWVFNSNTSSPETKPFVLCSHSSLYHFYEQDFSEYNHCYCFRWIQDHCRGAIHNIYRPSTHCSIYTRAS